MTYKATYRLDTYTASAEINVCTHLALASSSTLLGDINGWCLLGTDGVAASKIDRLALGVLSPFGVLVELRLLTDFGVFVTSNS